MAKEYINKTFPIDRKLIEKLDDIEREAADDLYGGSIVSHYTKVIAIPEYQRTLNEIVRHVINGITTLRKENISNDELFKQLSEHITLIYCKSNYSQNKEAKQTKIKSAVIL